MLNDQRGQALVEFALCIVIFSLFIFGLIGASIWGATSFLAQEIAHESAREYAVSLDSNRAENVGQTYLKRWGYIFIDTSDVQVDTYRGNNKTAVAIVKVKPKEAIRKLYIFKMPQIEKKSEATLEHYIRHPEEYVL